jgi:hypothetical protein
LCTGYPQLNSARFIIPESADGVAAGRESVTGIRAKTDISFDHVAEFAAAPSERGSSAAVDANPTKPTTGM